MSADENNLHHPTLRRTLRGEPSASTIQFRNLRYASIPARYQEPIPDDKLEVGKDGVYDATQFGPSCPQLHGAQAWDLTLIGDAVLPCGHGQGKTENMNEFDCLNVIVTVPKGIQSNEKSRRRGLPVFVWVHGGGLSIGSNSWPQYDLRRLVERGAETDKPFIGVAMDYRLNIFGFLASDEIGAAGNMGYKDQVLAFRWVKKAHCWVRRGSEQHHCCRRVGGSDITIDSTLRQCRARGTLRPGYRHEWGSNIA